jgi:hypothetical protein
MADARDDIFRRLLGRGRRQHFARDIPHTIQRPGELHASLGDPTPTSRDGNSGTQRYLITIEDSAGQRCKVARTIRWEAHGGRWVTIDGAEHYLHRDQPIRVTKSHCKPSDLVAEAVLLERQLEETRKAHAVRPTFGYGAIVDKIEARVVELDMQMENFKFSPAREKKPRRKLLDPCLLREVDIAALSQEQIVEIRRLYLGHGARERTRLGMMLSLALYAQGHLLHALQDTHEYVTMEIVDAILHPEIAATSPGAMRLQETMRVIGGPTPAQRETLLAARRASEAGAVAARTAHQGGSAQRTGSYERIPRLDYREHVAEARVHLADEIRQWHAALRRHCRGMG